MSGIIVISIIAAIICAMATLAYYTEASSDWSAYKPDITHEMRFPWNFRFNKKIISPELVQFEVNSLGESTFIAEVSWLFQKPILICWLNSKTCYVEMETGKKVCGGWYRVWKKSQVKSMAQVEIEAEIKKNKQKYLRI